MKRPAFHEGRYSNMLRRSGPTGPGPRPAAGLLAVTSAALLAAVLAGRPGVCGASSIFDDDWKPPANPSKPVKPAEPPPPPPEATTVAPPRLPAKSATPGTLKTPRTPSTPSTPSTPAAPAGPAPLVRSPVPDAAAVAAAEKVVKEVFKAEYAGKTAAEQSAFARALLGEAQQTRNDPPTLYVLLRDARDLAAASGDVEVAVEAARCTRDAFQMEAPAALELEQSTYASAIRGMAVAPPALMVYTATHRAADLGMQIAEYDLGRDDYAAAAAAASSAEQAANRTKDWEYPARVRNRAAALQAIAAAYEQDKAAIAGLKANPAGGNDPAANLAAGRFYAFVCDQYGRGLPLLAKGSDPVLKALAAKDLALGPQGNGVAPGSEGSGSVFTAAATATVAPDQVAAVADAWAEMAKAQTLLQIKDSMQRRALFWYAHSLPALEGLSKAAVQKRAMDLRASRVQKGIAGHYFRGQDFGYEVFARTDPRIEFNWAGYAPENAITAEKFSIRWEGYIKAPPGQYKLLAIHDDGTRVWVDGQLVIDKWGERSGKESQYVQLTGELQPIKIDYMQILGSSHMGLGWVAPKAIKGKAVPNESFFHDPLPPGPVYTALPKPDRDGQIVLTPGAAQVQGSLRLKQGDGPDHLEHWDALSSWVNWDFEAAEGEYDVDLAYSSNGPNAGSTYLVTVGLNRLNGTVANSGGFTSFPSQRIGRVRLGTGLQSLRVRALTKTRDWVMNLGQVMLTPVRKG